MTEEEAPRGRLHCELVTDFAALEALATQWAQLHARMSAQEIFQDFRWIQAWWRTLGKSAQLFTPVAYRGDQLAGLLPLVLEGRRLRFLAHSVSDYNHLVAPAEVRRVVLECCLDCLHEHAWQWTEIMLESVPESSDLAQAIRQLPGRLQCRVVETKADPCPMLVLDTDKGAVLRSRMSKLRRAVNRLSRHGQLRFRHLDNPQEATEKLSELVTQHVRRSALAGRRSRFLDQSYPSFFQTLLEIFAPDAEIRFSVLELDQRTIACHFGSLYAGKYLWYKPSFDVDLWELAPGQVLLWYLLDHLQTTDVTQLDFGRGDEPFKQRFANQVCQNLNFVIYSVGPRALLKRAYCRLRASAREQLRAVPRAERAVVAGIAALQSLPSRWRHAGGIVTASKVVIGSFSRTEEWLLLLIDPSSASPPAQLDLHFAEISLGRIADLAAAYPELFNPERLTLARQWCRQGRTAWVAKLNSGFQAIVWTSSDGTLVLPNGSHALPDRSILVMNIWPLAPQRKRLAVLLEAFGRTANERSLAAFAVFPKRALPHESTLARHGMSIQRKWEIPRTSNSHHPADHPLPAASSNAAQRHENEN